MQNARVIGSQKLPWGFQRQAWNDRQGVAGPESLKTALDRVMHEVERVKPKRQWRPQGINDARNVECLLREGETASRDTPEEKGHMGCSMRGRRGGAAHALGNSHPTTIPSR